MMKKIQYRSVNNYTDYNIHIGNNIISKILPIINIKKYSKIGILADDYTYNSILPKLLPHIGNNFVPIILQRGEKEKNFSSLKKVLKTMFENSFDKKSVLINLGGGVICDVGGLAAGLYLRGIDHINIPTTLMSQADAAIGGKTAINFWGLKNTVGIINHPTVVISDISFLKTLSKRDFTTGFVEMFKIGIIFDKKFFQILKKVDIKNILDKEIVYLIHKSNLLKLRIVSQDEKDNNVRKLLNFGHTVGHAVEEASQKQKRILNHGESVLLGMLAEIKLSNLLGLLSKKEYLTIKSALMSIGFLHHANLSYNIMYKNMTKDKKNNFNQILFSLPIAIGSGKYDIKAPTELVEISVRSII
ncbi:3-dehydroquinate synthase family protein [Patescibacteria group bacterium]